MSTFRVHVKDGVPLRGNHGEVRTGTPLDGVSKSGTVVLKMDEPDGRVAGPFYPGEYDILGNSEADHGQ